MNANIKGAKGGEKKARQPVVAVDSAQSKTFIKILYGLSEGEIEGLANGLKSVYLDDTPIEDDNGNSNFQNITTDFRAGTNDQTYIEGFPDISSETAVGIELKSGTPWVRAISNTMLDAVRLRLKWGALREQNASNGDVNGYTIEYAVDVQTDGGTWTEALKTKVSDKTSANYERSHRIDLPKASRNWQIRVRRITPNTTSEYISDKMYIEAITEVIDLKLSYPNTALFGLQYDAETFSSVAKIAIDLKGVKLKVPSNYDAENRTYIGIWDGTFKRAYSNNPAWIYYDICTSKRYALGDRLTSAMLDKWSLYRLGQYCDQLVDDGKGGQEPRFTCNIYLQSTEDAYAILTKLAGVFRAISFWDGNSIICDADIPQDTYFTYTRANVIDGHFEYLGTRARDRHTVAKVAFDNPNNRYKTEYEFVRNEKAISKLGVKIAEIAAWGCTSQGQAQRAGLWALKSEQLETRSVSFKVGLDGYIPQPGRVIEIADELFAGRANGGRVSVVSVDHKTVTVDRDNVVCRAGDRLVVNGEDGKAQARIVASITGRNITVTVAFDSIAAQNVWAVDAQDLKTMKFRVMSITQDDKHQFSINALQYEPSKYDAIDFGAHIDDRPISIINPTVQAPVESVSISAENMVQQGLSVATMLITWPQAIGATKYLIEWRKDDGSWLKLPITGNNSVEVQGIYSGNYEAKVTAINAFDVSSMPTYSMLTALTGKAGKPPKLAFINAEGILFGMKLNWGFPNIGALDTAYTEIQVSPDGVANIAQLGLFAYPTTTHSIQGMQPNLTQKYRGRLIDRIGNVGEWSNWATGTTSADASAVLDILNGKITESQLHQDLQTKIDLIDHIETIDAEIEPILQDIQNTKAQIAQEIVDRKAAIKFAEDGLTQQINDGDAGVLKVVNTVKQSSEQGIAAVQTEIEVVANDLTIASTKIDGVYAQVNPPLIGSTSDLIGSEAGFAGVWSEQSARIENDMALGIRIDTTAVQIADVQAFAQSEVTARIQGDEATVQKVDTYIASNNSALATVRNSATVAVNKSNANAELIDAINLELGGKASTGALNQVKSDLTVVDNKVLAQTNRIDGVYAQVNPLLMGSTSDLIGSEGGYAGVWSEQSARIENDMAIGIRTDQVTAQMNQNQANVLTRIKTLSDVQSSQASRIDTVQSSTQVAQQTANQAQSTANDGLSKANAANQNIATVQIQVNTLSTQQGATAQQVGTIQTKVGKNTASIQEVAQSVNGLYAQKYIKLDVNGKVAGWGGANDGKESNFILNFDSFAIGSGGSTGYYPFIFRSTPFTDPLTGMIFPVSAYLQSAMFDYQSVKTAHIEDLSVKTAKIDNLAVTSGKIDNLAVTTLKIQDEAVTVPNGIHNGNVQSWSFSEVNSPLAGQLYGERILQEFNVQTSGGKLRVDGMFTYACDVIIGALPAGQDSRKCITLVCQILINNSVVYTQEIYPIAIGQNFLELVYVGATSTPIYIHPASTSTLNIKLKAAVMPKINGMTFGTNANAAKLMRALNCSISTIELKK